MTSRPPIHNAHPTLFLSSLIVSAVRTFELSDQVQSSLLYSQASIRPYLQMLVTRQLDTEHSHWPFSKYDPSPRKPPSPRMSERYDTALSTQSDWQGQYPYSSHGESGTFPLPFGPDNDIDATQSPSAVESAGNALGILVKEEPGSPAGRERLQHSPRSSPVSKATGSARSRSPIPLPLDEPIPASSFGQGNKSPSPKDEEDVEFDEEEILEVDGDLSSQTAAERTAARRKMKRFRYDTALHSYREQRLML